MGRKQHGKAFHYYGNDAYAKSEVVVNMNRFCHVPVLIAMPVDEAGLWVEQVDEQEVIAHYQDLIHKKYPDKKIQLEDILVTKWNSDPYSRGSYCHAPIGFHMRTFNAIAQEVNRIHFAGEATSLSHHSTVHGAYLSGMREAAKIIVM